MGRPRKVSSVANTDVKNNALEERIKQLESIIEKLTSQTESPKDKYSDNFNEEKIPQDDYIKVISLCPVKLNLSTLGMGKGEVFSFNSFGETKRILYSDLVKVMEHQKDFLKNGLFYIDDARVIKRHGLDEYCSAVLNKEKIEKIIKNEENAISLFKSANTIQKQSIVQIFIDKLAKGENIDLNLIDALSRESGIKINEKAEEVKEIFLSQ